MNIAGYVHSEDADFRNLPLTKAYLDELRRETEFGLGIWWSPSLSLALLNVGRNFGDDKAYGAVYALASVKAGSIDRVFFELSTSQGIQLRQAYERVVSGAYKTP